MLFIFISQRHGIFIVCRSYPHYVFSSWLTTCVEHQIIIVLTSIQLVAALRIIWSKNVWYWLLLIFIIICTDIFLFGQIDVKELLLCHYLFVATHYPAVYQATFSSTTSISRVVGGDWLIIRCSGFCSSCPSEAFLSRLIERIVRALAITEVGYWEEQNAYDGCEDWNCVS